MKITTVNKYLKNYHLEGDCWIWDGWIDRLGYGGIGGGNTKHIKAHRFFYEHHRESIPEGMTIDHLCRNRRCVNPEHLEVVSSYVNKLRAIRVRRAKSAKTHCFRGHEYTPENTMQKTGILGGRECRICRAARDHNRQR